MQVLEGARCLVEARGTWTRFRLALTRNNRDCEPTDAKAARFCAYGALIRSAYNLTGDVETAHQLADSVAMSLTGRAAPHEASADIYTMDDGPPASSRKAILALLDRSLARV